MAFDLDEFVTACDAAVRETDRASAIREVLHRAATDTAGILAARGEPRTGALSTIHNDATLTVLEVVWTPGMRIGPHDHRMLAGIVVYGGSEDNAFFRRTESDRIEPTGGRVLQAGDVCMLGSDVIHRVQADRTRYTGALHVYAGDFFDRERSTWSEETGEAVDDPRPVSQLFDEAEADWKATRSRPAPT